MFGRAVLLFRTCLHPARPEMNINHLILQAIIMSFFQVSSGQLISVNSDNFLCLDWSLGSLSVFVLYHLVERSSVVTSNISNTRKSVSSDIQTPRSGWKNEAQPRFFFNQLQGVWISDETPFRMFDIASQTINNSWRKSKQKFTKFYDN